MESVNIKTAGRRLFVAEKTVHS